MKLRWPRDQETRQHLPIRCATGRECAHMATWRRAWFHLVAGVVCGLLSVWWFHPSGLAADVFKAGAQPMITRETIAGQTGRVLWNALRSSLPQPEPANRQLADAFRGWAVSGRLATKSRAIDSLQPSGHAVLAPGWSVPDNVSISPESSRRPQTVVTSGGVAHAVWEEGIRIYHSVKAQDAWSIPQLVATGERPSLAVAQDDSIHLVFGNEFDGDYNVFYMDWRAGVWTLPRLVSKTSGVSTAPSIALDANQVVHAIWEDTTPGYPVIYHGWLDGTWLNEPLTNMRGTSPVLTQDGNSAWLHLAWQTQGPKNGPHDIYYSHGTTYTWSVPENISATSDRDSTNVSLACDLNGEVRLVWREQGSTLDSIRYAGGRQGYWSAPENISGDVADAVDPAVAVAQQNQLHAVWQEGRTIIHRTLSGGTHTWRPRQAVIAGDSSIEQTTIAATPSGDVHLLWVGEDGTGQEDIFHSLGPRALPPQVFLPAVLADGP